MAQWIKQSTEITIRIGPFLDEDDGKTQETGLTISQADIRLSKNGGDFAQSNDSSGATADEAGWYYLTLDTTDTNTLGRLIVAIHESGALPVWREFMVVPSNVWDSFFGSDMLQVDVHSIDDDETAANNLESYCDGTTPIPANATEVEGSDATNQIGDAVLDEVVEGSYTLRQLIRLIAASLFGKSSGGGTATHTYRDTGDTKNRVTATVQTSTGNRTAVSLDGS